METFVELLCMFFDLSKWFWVWCLAAFMIFKFLKSRWWRTFTFALLCTVTSSSAIHFFNICQLTDQPAAKARAKLGQEYYLLGLENLKASKQNLAKNFFVYAEKTLSSSGDQMERPGVLRQLWHVNRLLGQTRESASYCARLDAIDPALTHPIPVIDTVLVGGEQYYDADSIDRYETVLSSSSIYCETNEKSLLNRLKLHQLSLPAENSIICQYFGSGQGPSSPILSDVISLGNFYCTQQNWNKAGEIYKYGMKVYVTMQAPTRGCLKNNYDRQRASFLTNYAQCFNLAHMQVVR